VINFVRNFPFIGISIYKLMFIKNLLLEQVLTYNQYLQLSLLQLANLAFLYYSFSNPVNTINGLFHNIRPLPNPCAFVSFFPKFESLVITLVSYFQIRMLGVKS